MVSSLCSILLTLLFLPLSDGEYHIILETFHRLLDVFAIFLSTMPFFCRFFIVIFSCISTRNIGQSRFVLCVVFDPRQCISRCFIMCGHHRAFATLISKVIVYGSRKADIEERIFSLIAKIAPKNQDTVFVNFFAEKKRNKLNVLFDTT